MTIAQQRVASEVTPRACTLPMVLIEARAAVFDPCNCLDLNITARRALFGILTFFNLKKPAAAIFPSRERLRADSLLNSDSALYRGLKGLEQHGYIVRDQIRNNRTGRFYLSPIRLTEKALVLLKLTTAGKVIHKHPPAKVEDGQYKEHTNDLQHSLQKSPATRTPARKVDPQTHLPTPLLPLVNLGLTPKTVSWLMAQAKAHGKLLEDVMRAAWHRLVELRGRAVVAYLRALFTKEQDFATTWKQRDQEARIEEQRRDLKAAAEAIDHRYDGFVAVTSKGTIIGIVDATTKTICVDVKTSLPINAHFMARVKDGAVRLVPPGAVPQPNKLFADAETTEDE